MFKNFVKGILLVFIAVLITGCSSTKDITVRRYIQEKARVDQEVQGTVGNWQNAPEAVVDPNRRPTRRIYVVEFSKEADQNQDVDELGAGSKIFMDEEVETTTRIRSITPKMDLPSFDGNRGVFSQQATSFTDYTVEKNDTLQKISKKFYDSYSKWPRIYEVNRDVLKNPDSIKPGMVIKIPVNN